MSIDSDILELLSDFQVARISAPVRSQPPVHLDGTVRFHSPSLLEILLPPGHPSPEHLDPHGEWRIVCDRELSAFSIKARFQALPESRRALLEVLEIQRHDYVRRHHRVDAEVYLNYWPGGQLAPQFRKAQRQKVNISGCGIRFRAGSPFSEGEKLGLEITLPGPTLDVVRCVGRVARLEREGEGDCQVVAEIAEIAPDDLDVLITFCMAEQFRRMQTNVRLLASVISPSLEPPPPDSSPEDSSLPPNSSSGGKLFRR